ncbi:hypothetical protein LLY42_23980 [Pseudomonas frederiksbergensis]|nr:hypothetical protein LLY42_23980 [Pseudomonas frederiksbergensis]
MFREDKEKVQNHWQEEIYPRQNSIMSNNGFYCLFETSEKEQSLKNKTWLPALDFSSVENGLCEGLATIYTTEDSKGNIIQCGECLASGEDGFISLTKKDTDELVWLIVLSTTNPFDRIELHGEFIHATSSSGIKVTIPPERPDKLAIQWK